MPRHSAGSLELNEGTGPITALCPCGEFLEIYKLDKTFRVKTPEIIDPEEINPNMPFVASPVDDVGSSNPIIARVLLQGHEILKSATFESNVEKEAVTKHLHSCKESLVVCEKTAKRVKTQIDRIIHEVNTNGISTDKSGRAVNPFPQVQDLDSDCATFLIQANRAIKLICELPRFFLPLDKADSNFEYLGKRLATTVGSETPLTQFVMKNAGRIRYLIDLRNFHEHPKKKKTVVDNFRLMPDATIRVPMWYLSEQQPRPIKEEMFDMINFLIQVAEAMLIYLVMYSVSKQFPFIIEEIPEKDIDFKNPMKYRLTLDISKLRQ